MKDYNALGNIQFGKDFVLFSINPEIYSLNIVKSAALEFTEQGNVILDGHPQNEILVELRSGEAELKELANNFNKLLLKHANRN